MKQNKSKNARGAGGTRGAAGKAVHPKKRRRRRGLSDGASANAGHARTAQRWRGLDNLGVALGTRAAWRDNLATVVGGLMYVVVPTALEKWTGSDLTGWRGYLTSISVNLLIGGLLREPGYIAGTLGASAAHFVYARLQDAIIQPVFGQFAYRFDPTVTTSSMSDDAKGALPPGTMLRNVAGETIALYPPSPSVANVGVEDNYQRDLGDNYQQDLADNFQPDLGDNYQTSLRDNYQTSLSDNYRTDLGERYGGALGDNFQMTLRDAFGGNDPWGNDLAQVLARS